ncbi:DUF2778 domain-containing protein [Bradyrhizobium manausense]|nr:DUF2778 domain-containing protein [Bradyrhizobium manausense]
MVSDARHAERLLSRRRRIGRGETILLSLAAMALSLGAAAWIADLGSSTPFATAALTPGPQASFADRFAPPMASAPAGPDSSIRPLERSAVSAFRLKLQDAKALLAQQLLYQDWRAGLSEDTDDDDAPAEDARQPVQKTDIPMPRSRPAQADIAAQIASSQAFASTTPATDNRTMLQKLGDLWPGKIRLASLTPGDGLFRKGPDLAALGYDSQTAVYDISARAVYLPGGLVLEAHSGMGNLKDDPDHVDKRMVGATPPATYDLKPREKLFHGVRALRMTPAEGSSALGRVGLLTHSYMLGPGGDSNGCVSIKDYERFLKAYDNGEFSRLVVVPNLSGATSASKRATSSDS